MAATKRRIHAGLFVTLAATQVWAQQGDTRIDTQVRLDANAQVGSNGYNTAILPRFVSSNTDLYITGNITGGRAFRAFSPIADGTAFRASTPSASLSRFERDSISYQDIAAGRSQILPNPYYSRSRTATTYGTLSAGFNQFGGIPSAGFYSRPARTPAYMLPRYGLPYAPDWTQTATPPDALSLPLTVSLAPTRLSVFAQPVGVTTDRHQAASWPSWLGTPGPFQPGLLRLTPTEAAQADGPLPTLFDAVANPEAFDLVRNSSTTQRPGFDQDPEALEETQATTTPLRSQSDAPLPLTWSPSQGPALPDVPQPPGGPEATPQQNVDATLQDQAAPDDAVPAFQPDGDDLLNDLQSAYLFITRVTQREAQIMAALEGRPADQERHQQELQDAWRLFAEPVSTFAGTGNQTVRQYIRTAEALVREGKYYQARNQYERARDRDRRNPLVLLGLGHTLLAAGEYYSAALMISRAVETFPAMAYLQFDLRQFVPQADLLEIRRADLERRLEDKEDLRFRFLLGYAEFYSGLPQFGMPNLQRAAQQAPDHSGVARLYRVLRQKQKADQDIEAGGASPK